LAVFDDENAEQQHKGEGRHGEEIECHQGFAVILQEGSPLVCRVTPASNAAQVVSHGSLGNDEAGLPKLFVDPGGSPNQAICRQPPDQRPELFGDTWSAAPRLGPPAPVETEAGAVPSVSGLRVHDHKHVAPAGPEVPESHPEKSVQGVRRRPRLFVFEHGDLLSEGEDFEGE
jgi:hypothetical protein